MKNSTFKNAIISITMLFGATSVYASSMQTECSKDKIGCEKSVQMESESMMKDDKMMKDEMKMKSSSMEKDGMKKDKM
ncbi:MULTISPECIES: hypothetical protein [Pasteurellaceae]|uniref:Pentapeptide MXKDX repeat protein n=1 Tax=Rodentibacter genomosp. 1 TaxID=1908264 RepID=A0A1V3J9D6_9PAST|nr:hypothetical protein [Rodentibacter genomosp. 1]OOF52057.1 hypothetical protein BKK54_00075 [Rodentibacter genomosp. 1]